MLNKYIKLSVSLIGLSALSAVYGTAMATTAAVDPKSDFETVVRHTYSLAGMEDARAFLEESAKKGGHLDLKLAGELLVNAAGRSFFNAKILALLDDPRFEGISQDYTNIAFGFAAVRENLEAIRFLLHTNFLPKPNKEIVKNRYSKIIQKIVQLNINETSSPVNKEYNKSLTAMKGLIEEKYSDLKSAS
jgi:hypothetical protein